MEDINNLRLQYIDKLNSIIAMGAGASVKIAHEQNLRPWRMLDQEDIDRAYRTIANLSEPYDTAYLAAVAIRINEIHERRVGKKIVIVRKGREGEYIPKYQKTLTLHHFIP